MATTENRDVNVKLTNTGRTTNYQLHSHNTIEDVCKEVANEENVSAKQIIIKYTGKILNRIHSLSFLGVRPETVLKAEVVPLKKYSINVKKEDGVTFPMAIENISTTQDIKEMVMERLDVMHPATVEMQFNGKTLEKSSSTAHSIGLNNDCLLNVKVIERSAGATSSNNQENGEDILDEETLQELLSSFVVEAGNKVEVVFSFDTTGSMAACLHEVRTKVEETTSRLLRDIENIRIGVMAHGDYCDHNYVLRTCDLTNDQEKLIQFINNVPSTGGGDAPEAYEWVLKKAQDLSWTEGSARALVMIGDDKPHPPSYTDQKINWHNELDKLRDMNVKVYGVQAHQHSSCNIFYEELAERTAGTYLKLAQFKYITDMFLAVCYREASDDQLQAYCEEVKNDGRMTEELSTMFVKLEEKPKEPTENNKVVRYVAMPWWDPTIDEGVVKFSYNKKNDEWRSVSENRNRFSVKDSRPHVEKPKKERIFLSFRKSKRGKKTSRSGTDEKCAIM